MSKSSEENSVSTWQRLMLQWDAAHTSYKTALEAFAALGELENHEEEREAAEKTALNQLREIKEKINRLIKECGSRRKPEAGSIVFGMIEREVSHRNISSLPKVKPRR